MAILDLAAGTGLLGAEVIITVSRLAIDGQEQLTLELTFRLERTGMNVLMGWTPALACWDK